MSNKLTTSDTLTIAAAAEAAGVPERTLRDAVARGDVPSRLIADRWQVVERADVEHWAHHRPRRRGRKAKEDPKPKTQDLFRP